MRKRVTIGARGRAAFAALPVLVLLVAVVSPTPLRAEEDDPCFTTVGEQDPQKVPAPVCGTTVIEGAGQAGVTLDVPQQMLLPTDNYEVSLLGDTSYAFVGLADPDPDACGRDISPLFGMCLTHKVYKTKMPGGFTEGGREPPMVEKGVQHLYIVSDGAVRITLVFDELEGENTLEATGTIRASSEWLEPTCPTAPDCGNLGWGGATHVARHPGFVGVFASSRNPGNYLIEDRIPYPGTRSARACLYPSSGSTGGSSDPADHPTGCSFSPTDGGDWAANATWFALTSTSPVGGSVSWFTENLSPDGSVYAGFAAQQISTETPGGGYGAFAVWLEEGIEGETVPPVPPLP